MMLEPQVLDRLYHQWKYADRLNISSKYPMKYQNSRRDQRFEDWLWTQGFTVVQKDKKRYMRFSGDPRQLTIFLLKYT
jgi:hypothetical protein